MTKKELQQVQDDLGNVINNLLKYSSDLADVDRPLFDMFTCRIGDLQRVQTELESYKIGWF